MSDFDKTLHAQLRHLIDDLTVAVDNDGHARYAPKNTLMFSNFIAALIELMPTLAARAQTAQAVPLLSDAAIRDVRDSFGDEPIGLYALSRAIEAVVRAKLGVAVPMTDERRYSEFCNWYANAECQMTPTAIFDEAFRRAEEVHGIVGKEGGNV